MLSADSFEQRRDVRQTIIAQERNNNPTDDLIAGANKGATSSIVEEVKSSEYSLISSSASACVSTDKANCKEEDTPL